MQWQACLETSFRLLEIYNLQVNLATKVLRAFNLGLNASADKQGNKVPVIHKPQLRPFWWEFSSYPFPIMDIQFSPLWSDLKALPPKPEQQCAAVKEATFEQVLQGWHAVLYTEHACMAASIQTESCQLRQVSKAHWPVTVPGFAYATHTLAGGNVTVSNSTSIRFMVETAITKLIDNCNSHAKALQTIAATTADTVGSHMSADYSTSNAAFYAAVMAFLVLVLINHVRY
jgi:hypothetical protein